MTQRRNPEATRKRILAAATVEFAAKGLGGARVDTIAKRSRTNKRMLYHYFGNKEALFTAVLEEAYGRFREAEAKLEIERDDPASAMARLVRFTWEYYLDHPEFLTLVNSENLHRARHIRASKRMSELNRPFVNRMANLLERGAAVGQFQKNLDPVQVLITVAAVGYHYLNNQHTGAIVYDRDLMSKAALAQRLDFNINTVLRTVAA